MISGADIRPGAKVCLTSRGQTSRQGDESPPAVYHARKSPAAGVEPAAAPSYSRERWLDGLIQGLGGRDMFKEFS